MTAPTITTREDRLARIRAAHELIADGSLWDKPIADALLEVFYDVPDDELDRICRDDLRPVDSLGEQFMRYPDRLTEDGTSAMYQASRRIGADYGLRVVQAVGSYPGPVCWAVQVQAECQTETDPSWSVLAYDERMPRDGYPVEKAAQTIAKLMVEAIEHSVLN